MGSSHRLYDLGALGAFVLIAGAPFLLTMCSPDKPQPSSPAASASVITVASAQESSAAPPASSSAPPPPVVSSPAPDPTPPPSQAQADAEPPYKGPPLPTDCKEIRRMQQSMKTDGPCKSDSDCGTFAEYCGCPHAVVKSALPKLHALSDSFQRRECYRRMQPIPCATCAPAPTPRCVSNRCQ